MKQDLFNEQLFQRLEQWISGLPDWAISTAIFILAIALGALVQRLVYRLLSRLTENQSLFWRSVVSRTRTASRIAVLALALSAAAAISPLTTRQAEITQHVLVIVVTLLVAWMAHSVLYIWSTLYLRRFKLDAEDNLLARKHATQTRILRRVGNTLILAVAIAWMLMTFEPVRQYGVSLLASAGAAGLVVGIALQPILKNLFAGIQLAITQPIRIDDALLVEGEWGKVEEITSTYVVLKIWDWRRLILPLSYFMEQPFQNWTRETASLIGAVKIYLDFTIPVDVIRAETEKIVANSKLWDRQVINVAVVEFHERVMEVRILASASDSGRAFDLRCEIRENLITFIQKNYPATLPRTRAEVGLEDGKGDRAGNGLITGGA